MCGIVEKEDFDMMKERYGQNLQELRDGLQAANRDKDAGEEES